MEHLKITVDGVDYDVEIEHDGDVITVSDAEGRVANAERDHAVESVSFAYFTPEEGCIAEASLSDLFQKTPADLAHWLVSTHPIHG